MQIRVIATDTVGSLQGIFQAAFPYLKLVFFSIPHRAFEGSPAKYILNDPDRPLGKLQTEPHDGELLLEPSTPTWQVEQMFEEEFGLHVQVFRKSGPIWLETSRTDSLTLEQQNIKGRAGDHIASEETETEDFREQE